MYAQPADPSRHSQPMGVVYVAERRLVSPRLTSTLVGRNRQVWYRDLPTERLVLDVGWLLTAARPLGGLQSPKNGRAVLPKFRGRPSRGQFCAARADSDCRPGIPGPLGS